MDSTQQELDLDGPSREMQYQDTQVADLYEHGLISRAEADVFDIIASFNDGDEQGAVVVA